MTVPADIIRQMLGGSLQALEECGHDIPPELVEEAIAVSENPGFDVVAWIEKTVDGLHG